MITREQKQLKNCYTKELNIHRGRGEAEHSGPPLSLSGAYFRRKK